MRDHPMPWRVNAPRRSDEGHLVIHIVDANGSAIAQMAHADDQAESTANEIVAYFIAKKVTTKLPFEVGDRVFHEMAEAEGSVIEGDTGYVTVLFDAKPGRKPWHGKYDLRWFETHPNTLRPATTEGAS
jgi:hypothetical protein